MKKILTCISFLFLSGPFLTHAECIPGDNTGYDQYSRGQYSYECNVQNLCLGTSYGGDYWNFDTSKQLIITHDKTKYPDLSGSLKIGFSGIREIYHKTQNTIMNCAIIKSKYTMHKTMIESYTLSKKAKESLEKANKSYEKTMKELECIAPRGADKIYAYKDLLDSMTYEQCVYNMYLFYLENAAQNNIGALVNGGGNLTAIGSFAKIVEETENAISAEYDLSRRAMDTALSLYQNFERTYPAHVMLQMIEIELTSDKRFMGVTVKALQQFVSLVKNAQRSQGSR